MVVEVLPDVSGIDRTFAYEVPAELAGRLRVGCIVRVVLHGRRVRGWVVAEVAAPPPEIDLRPVSELVSLGPPPAVVDLSRWAAWRYSGRLRPLLVAASPPRLGPRAAAGVASAGGAGRDAERSAATPPGRNLEREIAAATLQALSCQFRGPAASAGGAEAGGRRGGHRGDGRQATATCWSWLLRERTP